MAIADRHEPSGAALVLREWWERSPTTFKVVRDRLGGVAGFLAYGTPEDVHQALTQDDPLLSRWLADVRRNHPMPRGQRVLLLRRALMRDHGEALCPEMGAAWLEIKRVYMEMRPHLRRVYTALREVEPVWATLNPLGFEAPQGGPTEIEGTPYHSAVLDFGPSSVDGWLTRVVAAELMVEEEDRSSTLDSGRWWSARRGRVVRRTAILDDVWGYRGNYGGSNVIEAVVRSLRRKLGAAAGMIETVRGTGYRLNVPPGRDPR